MELILISNCSLLYLHSNNIKLLKSLFLTKKRVLAINIINIENYKLS